MLVMAPYYALLVLFVAILLRSIGAHCHYLSMFCWCSLGGPPYYIMLMLVMAPLLRYVSVHYCCLTMFY